MSSGGPSTARHPQGPLIGIRIVEFAGMGPAPFSAMLFSDMGATVLRIDRPDAPPTDRFTLEARGRSAVALDLKTPEGRDVALQIIGSADGLIEGFRPGVMERLGLGPDVALARNGRLVYGRVTGWGQSGPYASMAGHDVNYLALSGALHGIGPAEKPAIPLNLIADFGGGALFLGMGMLAAMLHARATGEGQVVDAAMNEGTTALMTLLYGHLARGTWIDRRASNIIDGAAPFYNVYQCRDRNWIAFAAIEPQFYAQLLSRLGITDCDLSAQHDQSRWPNLTDKIATIVKTRTRAEWCALLEGSDTCFAPVMSMQEAVHHPHNQARNAFVAVDGVAHPAPAPRFSRTPGAIQSGPLAAGQNQAPILREWGVDEALIAALARR